jgi:hypothetical protein
LGAGRSGPGALRSAALTRNSGLLSNTGSRRVPDFPRPDAMRNPFTAGGSTRTPDPEADATGPGLRAR